MHSCQLPKSCFVACLLALQLSAQTTPQPSAPTSADEQQIIAAARARAEACASGDAQKWASFVDSDFRDVEGNQTATRQQIFDECQQSGRSITGHSFERVVSNFHFRFLGWVALVDYTYDFKEHFGDVSMNQSYRQVDTYEKRDGKWVAVLAVSAEVVPNPPTAKIDGSTLDEYTGQYAWGHYVDTVTRKGDKLYIQGSWEESPTELSPENSNTFFDPTAGISPWARVAFIKDKSGLVTEEHVYSPASGQGYSAKKIK
jgi:hypothetical protein